MTLLLLARRIASRLTLVDNYCKRCGRKAEAFHTDDATYARAVPDGGERCFRCFHREAAEHIAAPVWRVSLDG